MLACVDRDFALCAYEFAGTARFFAKPAAWDRTLWRLLGIHRAGRKLSPTFHYRGINATVPPLWEKHLKSRSAEALAGEIFAFAEASFPRVDRDAAGDFPSLMKVALVDGGRADHVVTEAIWHICEGRHGSAAEIARAVLSGERRATYSVSATPEGGGAHRDIFTVIRDEFDVSPG